MLRALSILLGGIVAAVLVAALISPSWSWADVLGPVLITTSLGVAVMAVTARRASLRDASERLRAAEQLREAGIEISREPQLDLSREPQLDLSREPQLDLTTEEPDRG